MEEIKILDTEELFKKEIIEKRAVHKILNMNSAQMATIKYDYKKGKVSIEKMRELLNRAGFELISEVWKKR